MHRLTLQPHVDAETFDSIGHASFVRHIVHTEAPLTSQVLRFAPSNSISLPRAKLTKATVVAQRSYKSIFDRKVRQVPVYDKGGFVYLRDNFVTNRRQSAT